MTVLSSSAGTIAAELTSHADAAFGAGSRANGARHSPPVTKEQEQT
jgi:hypothetical protein